MPVQDDLERVRRMLRNMGEVAATQSAIAWVSQYATATPDQVSTLIRAGSDYSRPKIGSPSGKYIDVVNYEPGTVLHMDANRQFVAGPIGAGTPGFIQVEQAILRGCGARWRFPEYFSGDASNNNMASSIVAGSPFVVAVEGNQLEWGVFERAVAKKVLELCVESGRLSHKDVAGIDVKVIPPLVALANREEEEKLRQMRHQAGVLSVTTWQQQVGLDPAHEVANFAAEAKRKAELGGGGAARGESTTLCDCEELVSESFTGKIIDALGRHRCYKDGKQVPCNILEPRGNGGTAEEPPLDPTYLPDIKANRQGDAWATYPGPLNKEGQPTIAGYFQDWSALGTPAKPYRFVGYFVTIDEKLYVARRNGKDWIAVPWSGLQFKNLTSNAAAQLLQPEKYPGAITISDPSDNLGLPKISDGKVTHVEVVDITDLPFEKEGDLPTQADPNRTVSDAAKDVEPLIKEMFESVLEKLATELAFNLGAGIGLKFAEYLAKKGWRVVRTAGGKIVGMLNSSGRLAAKQEIMTAAREFKATSAYLEAVSGAWPKGNKIPEASQKILAEFEKNIKKKIGGEIVANRPYLMDLPANKGEAVSELLAISEASGREHALTLFEKGAAFVRGTASKVRAATGGTYIEKGVEKELGAIKEFIHTQPGLRNVVPSLRDLSFADAPMRIAARGDGGKVLELALSTE